ncbi:MAG: Crp/Fnr family transcriptional regulator [Bdellovibrionales bacterium]
MPNIALPKTVKSQPLFKGLSEAEQDALLRGGRSRQLERGQLLFAHGDPVTHFYLVISGTLQLFRQSPDGHEKTLAILIGGQTLGETEIFEVSKIQPANAVAIEITHIVEFPLQWLLDNAQKHPVLALNLLASISEQAHDAQIEAEHQCNMSAAQLVACFLQRTCILHNFDPRGFELPYSKSLIASRLGMELETFSRTLGKLREHGIAVTGTHVTIYDMQQIEDYVCSSCSIVEDCPTRQKLVEIAGRRQG